MRLLKFGICILFVWVLCIIYVLYINPDLAMYNKAANLKESYGRMLTAKYGSKIVVYGGSGCGFSINGDRMLEMHGLPVVNYGMHLGLGPRVLSAFALNAVERGDTLIVALEPPSLTNSIDITTLGNQFAFRRNHPEWITSSYLGQSKKTWFSCMLDLRPGLQHLLVVSSKILLRKPMYRYTVKEMSPSGWQQTSYFLDMRAMLGDEKITVASTPTENEVNKSPYENSQLTDTAVILLRSIKAECERKGVRVAYSLPWGLYSKSSVEEIKKTHEKLITNIAEYMSVLRDTSFGIVTDPDQFADSIWHPKTPLANRRTDELARQIKAWDTWKRGALPLLQ
jgi:hypothetical protein